MTTTFDKLHNVISLEIVNAERLTFSEGVSADVYGLGSVKYRDLSFKGCLQNKYTRTYRMERPDKSNYSTNAL